VRSFMRTLLLFVSFTILTGLVYPFFITGLCQVIFPHKANGSLVIADGKIVGSDLIGQSFTSPKYFSGRPSAVEKPYDAGNSGGSNFGPSNSKFLEDVGKRISKVRQENGLNQSASVPADLVLASGSGLDPDISLESALLQVPRVAKTRSLAEAQVRQAVEELARTAFPGSTDKQVHVLKLNIAIDALAGSNRQ